MNFFDFVENLGMVNKKTAQLVVRIVVVLMLCIGPVRMWVVNQAMQKAQATVAPFSKAMQDATLQQQKILGIMPAQSRPRP